jgi:proline iminopeptidase
MFDTREETYLEHFSGEYGSVELYFEDVGPEDAPVLVYLHGGPGYNSYSFRDLAGDGLEHYRVIYLDQRGCGRSSELPDDPGLHTIDAFVDDIEQVRDFLGIDEWTLVGHGFGVVLALEYARNYREHSLRVVAINPWVHFPELAQTLLESAAQITGKPVEDDLETPAEQLEAAFSRLNARDLFNALQFKDARARMRLEFSDVESQLMASGTVQEMMVFNGLWELHYTDYLPDIHTPVSVICGAHDQTSYPGQVDWVIDLLDPDSYTLDTGHYPWVDDPEAFGDAIRLALHLEN